MNHFFAIIGIIILFSASCSNSSSSGDTSEFAPGKIPKDGVMQIRGGGNFQYAKYPPLAHKPLTVHYYLPSWGELDYMPVLFTMHGAERSGLNQINVWKYLAEANGIIVIAPEFSKENGYSENDYQFGGIFTSATFSSLRPLEEWTYCLLEALFDYVKNETGNLSDRYYLFGHSAGGQFVHRFLLAMPDARVNRAVAANPGSWTFPLSEGFAETDSQNYGWPYSIRNVPFSSEENLRRFFMRELYVQIGTEDIVQDAYFPMDNASMAQGNTRFERAHAFYKCCQDVAKKLSTALRIELVEVEGAGHSSAQMVYGNATVSLPQTDARETGNAFDLLFN